MSVTPDEMGFYGAGQIGKIHRNFVSLKSGRESDETVFVITGLASLPEAKANGNKLLEIARGQWAIENGNHYVRDRSYDEDRCQVREPNSAQVLATLRSLALFLAKQEAHHPRNSHQATTPALNRYCNAHRGRAIKWLMSVRGPK